MSINEPSISDAMRLASSPAGLQLIRILQQKGDDRVVKAIEKVSAGDMTQLGIIISAIMENPEARSLLQKLGGNYGQYGR